MNVNKFRKLMIELRAAQARSDAWLDTVPREVNAVFFDNPHVDTLERTKTILLDALFEDALRQEVDWFLYEWSPEKDVSYRTITYPNSSSFVLITDVEDFIRYLLADGLLIDE